MNVKRNSDGDLVLTASATELAVIGKMQVLASDVANMTREGGPIMSAAHTLSRNLNAFKVLVSPPLPVKSLPEDNDAPDDAVADQPRVGSEVEN